MENNITLIIEVAVKEGKANVLKDYFKTVAAKAEKDEPGTLRYTWSFNAEETEVKVIEQYADDAAYFAHVQNVDTSEVIKIASFKKITLCGNPAPQMLEGMKTMGAEIFSPMDGFVNFSN